MNFMRDLILFNIPAKENLSNDVYYNKGGDGAGEVVCVLGLIDNDFDFYRTYFTAGIGMETLIMQSIQCEDHADVKGTGRYGETLYDAAGGEVPLKAVFLL